MTKLKISNDISNFKNGRIYLQGSKNSMLNNLCLPLYTREKCLIKNVPDIRDINDNLDFLASLGCTVKRYNKNTIEVLCRNIKKVDFDPKLSKRTTGSKLFIPIIVNTFGSYKTGASQGCDIGDRGFLNYADSLKNFGIGYKIHQNKFYEFYLTNNFQTDITLPFPSFGLTVNAMLAAVASKQEISINNICQEAEIDNTIAMFTSMGAKINTNKDTLSINVVDKLHGCEFRNMSDRNAAVTYSIAALLANIELVIENYDDFKMEKFYDFLDTINVKYEINERSLIIYKSNIKLLNKEKLKIEAFLYPKFHSDWQPLVSPLLSTCPFKSYIEEWLFQNRLSHWKELGKMGASFEYDFENTTRFNNDGFPHAVEVTGNAKLTGCNVFANDLRSAACLVLASLVAKGETTIDNIEQLDRGYESLVHDLVNLGANMEYIN